MLIRMCNIYICTVIFRYINIPRGYSNITIDPLTCPKWHNVQEWAFVGKAICDLSGGATECLSSKSEKMCFTPPTPGIVYGFEVCSW